MIRKAAEIVSFFQGKMNHRSSGGAFAVRLNRRLIILLIPVILLFILLIAAAPGALQREHRYREANALLRDGDLIGAEEILQTIPSYRESKNLIEKEIPYLKANMLYQAATTGDLSALDNNGILPDYYNSEDSAVTSLFEAAAEGFGALGEYKDSEQLKEACLTGIEQEKARLAELERIAKQERYDQAVQMLSDGAYGDAIAEFQALGSFSDSKDMIQECIYKKAVSLFQFLSRYDVSRIQALISSEPGQTSIFSLPSDEALRLGSGCVDDLRAACGKDPIDIRLEDSSGDQLLPLKDALSNLFSSLGNYSDSAGYIDLIKSATDYTRDFYMLCSTGDLPAAKNWLDDYHGSFEDRDRWSELLNLYLPYCGDWVLYLGDSTLLSYTVGQSFPCMSVSSRVLLDQDTALLRLSFGESNSVTFDLPSALGETIFVNNEVPTGIYMAAINNGHFVYMMYNSGWTLISSSDYIPA